MRILFLTHRLPYAPNRGDRIRAFHILKFLSRRASVDLVSLVHDAEEASHLDEVGSTAATTTVVTVPRVRNMLRSVAALPTSTPTTHTMLDAPGLDQAIETVVRDHPPDIVFAYCSGMARLALSSPLRDVPLVLDLVDVDSAKWAELAAIARWPLSWIYAREATVLARFEAAAIRRARATVVVTDVERDTLRHIVPEARIHVVPNGVDFESLKPHSHPSGRPIVTFCGVMNYPPNEEAAAWMARDIWPLVRKQIPEARLQLVGATPSRRVRALADPALRVEVTGSVPDVRPYLWETAVAVAPLRQARGVQNKVLEAVAAGVPTVTTPKVMAGLPESVRAACVSADSTRAFADAVVRLLSLSGAERQSIVSRVNITDLSWPERLFSLQGIIDDVAPGSCRGALAV